MSEPNSDTGGPPRADVPHTMPVAKRSRTARYLLLALLGALLVVASFEFMPRYFANRAFRQIANRVPKDINLAVKRQVITPTRQEVRLIVGCEPDVPALRMPSMTREIYTWHGMFRRNTLYVDYHVALEGRVCRVFLSQPAGQPALAGFAEEDIKPLAVQ